MLTPTQTDAALNVKQIENTRRVEIATMKIRARDITYLAYSVEKIDACHSAAGGGLSQSVCGGGLVVASETPPAVTSMVEISSFPRGSADVGHGDWAALAHSTVLIHLTSLRTLL
ncbi:unnamed protein product, partial [Brenthis ino]